jgi:hypothetical protein
MTLPVSLRGARISQHDRILEIRRDAELFEETEEYQEQGRSIRIEFYKTPGGGAISSGHTSVRVAVVATPVHMSLSKGIFLTGKLQGMQHLNEDEH